MDQQKVTAREHSPVLSESQLAAYRDRGFITIRNILDQDLVGRLREATQRLWDESASVAEKTRYYDIAPGHSQSAPQLRRISSPTELDIVFWETAFVSPLGDIAADLVGGAVKFYHSKINFKLPRGGAEIGWHQDWPVFPHTNTNLVALSVPLNPSRAGNGCLKTIPGSHKQGALSHWSEGKYALNCNACMTEETVALAEFDEADPGDVLAHHGLVVHGSEANLSDEIRTTLIVQYAAADAFAYTAPVIDSIHRNDMVRGEAATHARVEAGVIELPPDFSRGYGSIFSHQEGAAKAS
ncbi:phytanoyl-CoA dioxygenase family protein [Limibacillus sp. MBR-115]|jgi:ectoine hydroxylase-related dioxygenase (phytanoyl-CoA dioxygenase family)|uniref:phytanoyl-CoA dioxygenase family protein n=1 Tax=Limibacillus sp. MBR-115 TaxID=3156465 RepID=UPI0033947EA6